MSAERIVASAFAMALASVVVGCALDAGSNTHGRCNPDGSCSVGICYRGFCVTDFDAALVPDGGHDAAMPGNDTGFDAGADSGSDGGGNDGGIDAALPDANTDGGNPCDGSTGTCMTGQPGVCNAGHGGCGPSGPTCVRDVDPVAETCDRRDQDCDGVVDEESNVRCYLGPATACTASPDGSFTCHGACRPGSQTCSGGSLGMCMGSIVPMTETCQLPSATGLDENCNGVIDEGCSCTTGTMRSCFTGAPSQAGVGQCVNGTQMCTGGAWAACMGGGSPMPETCGNNGRDDDCDGFIDNIPGRGASCSIPSGVGDCRDGTMQCSGGSGLMCVGPAPATTEVCDHHDDDCDGATDENFNFATDRMNCGDCGIACGMGQSCCNGRCVDEASDEMNCGACLATCTARTCCSRMCADTANDPMNCGACGTVCGSGQLCCTGRCVDPRGDSANCMTCGHACSGTQQCCGAACVPIGDPACTMCSSNCTTLSPPQTCCGSSCADRMTDELNCGTCGHACVSGEVCCAGACVASTEAHCGGACAVCIGQLCCSSACVAVDTTNCQACGVTCSAGSACCGTGCRNLTSDDANCGTCAHACAGATPHCSSGNCCATGTTWCGSSCVNTNTDANNCGTCGHRCTLGCNGSGQCNLI